jgi:apolipoprotein N-acyltransferase
VSGNLPGLIDHASIYNPSPLKGRLVVAAVAGLMLAGAFPKWHMPVLAWVVPGMMLAAAIGLDGGGAFRVGYCAGLAFHLGSLYWLLQIPVKIAPILGWMLLAAFLALYQGVWVWLCWRIYPGRHDPKGPSTLWERFLTTRWHRQLGWTLSCAAMWVTMEMIQARLFTGFPWNLLGASQFQMTPLIQIASITGVYGVSFLVVWLSVSILSAGAGILFRPAQPRDWMVETFPPLFVIVIIMGFGLRQVLYAADSPAKLKIALVQPSIPQEDIWNTAKGQERFQSLIRLSRDALSNQVDLLVWPEAAVPNLFRYDTNIHRMVTNLVREHDVWMVLGSEDLIWRTAARSDSDYDFYNSAMLLTPGGQLRQSYHKRHLVMFGEYVPFGKWLPFLREFTTVRGDFTLGQGPVTFGLTNLNVKTSVLICFEDNFPHLVREHVTPDLDFLLNLTNNGWFGESAAQWQHATNAVFRAVENGLPLVRCTNNGLTCWVDAKGRMHELYYPGTRDIYGPGYKIVRVPLLNGARRAPTMYRRVGDAFGWACLAWSVALVLTRGRVRVLR